MDKLPAQMTVVGITKPGGPEVLVPETRAVPQPGANEILIKVAAAGVTSTPAARKSRCTISPTQVAWGSIQLTCAYSIPVAW